MSRFVQETPEEINAWAELMRINAARMGWARVLRQKIEQYPDNKDIFIQEMDSLIKELVEKINVLRTPLFENVCKYQGLDLDHYLKRFMKNPLKKDEE